METGKKEEKKRKKEKEKDIESFDFSRDSILEARRRVRATDRQLQRLLTKPEYHVGNALEEKAWRQAEREPLFDVVSMQLAIHYMVSTQQQAADVLARCCSRLKIGGKFIGSTMCCREIVKNMLDLQLLQDQTDADAAAATEEYAAVCAAQLAAADGQKVFVSGNHLFAIFFLENTLRQILHPHRLPNLEDKTRPLRLREVYTSSELQELAFHLLSRLSSTFGIKYHFWLRGTIDADEFVFPFDAFRQTAASLGLECCLSASFPRLLDLGSADPQQGREVTSWRRGLLRRKDAVLDESQARIFSLYKAFSFVKTHNPTGIQHPTSSSND
ncbi:hypothetical protein Efla_000015 [Eimeria flavescens]